MNMYSTEPGYHCLIQIIEWRYPGNIAIAEMHGLPENKPFRIEIDFTDAYNGWTEGRFLIIEKDVSRRHCIMKITIANGDTVRAVRATWLLDSKP